MSTATPAPLDLNNIQGDILAQLAQLVPLITTTAQVQHDRREIAASKAAAIADKIVPPIIELSAVNIAFSHSGLVKIGVTDDIGDVAFNRGQFADAGKLGDQGQTVDGTFQPNWVPAFKNPVHGVILVSGSSRLVVEVTVRQIETILKFRCVDATVHEVLRVVADVRPGDQKGHEHFGFLDGISQPAVAGFNTDPNPGQQTVRQGIILLGREGDVPRPVWALDGSFLVLRYFFQLVPEFNAFKDQNALKLPGLTPAEGSDLLGARLFGRWKSGAPVDLAPLKDDPALATNPKMNNDFNYAFEDNNQTQDRCPFAAHTRKTNPRADLKDTEANRMIRRGCPFGPEVTPEEAADKRTHLGRGLVFVAYQSNIANGFLPVQDWSNDPTFPPSKPVTPGYDPVVGQAADPATRSISGTNPNTQSNVLALPAQWVVAKGGEYFFSPSISTLRDTFALVPPAHVPGRGPPGDVPWTHGPPAHGPLDGPLRTVRRSVGSVRLHTVPVRGVVRLRTVPVRGAVPLRTVPGRGMVPLRTVAVRSVMVRPKVLVG
nr:DyP-type peroxidase [Cyanosporus caesius]